MRTSWKLAILTIGWTISQAAVAENPYRSTDSRAASAKRQVIDCMNKRMAASRTLSYNDASRICNDQVKGQILAQQTNVAASATPQKAVSAP